MPHADGTVLQVAIVKAQPRIEEELLYAMAQGELDPADALAAGRVRVRGDLAALVAGQDVLAGAAAQLGTELTELTDPADAGGATGTVTETD